MIFPYYSILLLLYVDTHSVKKCDTLEFFYAVNF